MIVQDKKRKNWPWGLNQGSPKLYFNSLLLQQLLLPRNSFRSGRRRPARAEVRPDGRRHSRRLRQRWRGARNDRREGEVHAGEPLRNWAAELQQDVGLHHRAVRHGAHLGWGGCKNKTLLTHLMDLWLKHLLASNHQTAVNLNILRENRAVIGSTKQKQLCFAVYSWNSHKAPWVGKAQRKRSGFSFSCSWFHSWRSRLFIYFINLFCLCCWNSSTVLHYSDYNCTVRRLNNVDWIHLVLLDSTAKT